MCVQVFTEHILKRLCLLRRTAQGLLTQLKRSCELALGHAPMLLRLHDLCNAEWHIT